LKANQRKQGFNSTNTHTHTHTTGKAQSTEYIRLEWLLWAQTSTKLSFRNLQLQPPTKDILKCVSITRGERGVNRTRETEREASQTRGKRDLIGKDFKLLQRMSFMCEC